MSNIEADEEEDNQSQGGSVHDRRSRSHVPEPGVVLSGTAPQKWNLMSLSEAQGRSDIVRRPEGFEMSEDGPGRM